VVAISQKSLHINTAAKVVKNFELTTPALHILNELSAAPIYIIIGRKWPFVECKNVNIIVWLLKIFLYLCFD
jgi:hypothetical protein